MLDAEIFLQVVGNVLQVRIARLACRNYHVTCERNLGRAHRPDVQIEDTISVVGTFETRTLRMSVNRVPEVARSKRRD
jgi:hypothetical protein